ncbi:hypothetical protein I4U23_004227 [Adineta vaga]|nr:hypothetical protein I4U23_004227 [Adineta vaga]
MFRKIPHFDDLSIYNGTSYVMVLFVITNTAYSETYCNDTRITEVEYLGVLDELRNLNNKLTEDDVDLFLKILS